MRYDYISISIPSKTSRLFQRRRPATPRLAPIKDLKFCSLARVRNLTSAVCILLTFDPSTFSQPFLGTTRYQVDIVKSSC